MGFFIFFFHNTLLDLSKCLQEHFTAEAYVGCLQQQQQHYYCFTIISNNDDDDDFPGRGRGESKRGSWVRSGPIPSCPSNLTTTEDQCLLLTTSPLMPLWPRPSPTFPHSLSPSLPHPDQRSWRAYLGQLFLPLPVPPTLLVKSQNCSYV